MMEWEYVWRWRITQPARSGQQCRVVIRARGPGPRNLLVEWPDGHRVVAPWRAVRRARPDELGGPPERHK
jgi:hypothetical protein